MTLNSDVSFGMSELVVNCSGVCCNVLWTLLSMRLMYWMIVSPWCICMKSVLRGIIGGAIDLYRPKSIENIMERLSLSKEQFQKFREYCLSENKSIKAVLGGMAKCQFNEKIDQQGLDRFGNKWAQLKIGWLYAGYSIPRMLQNNHPVAFNDPSSLLCNLCLYREKVNTNDCRYCRFHNYQDKCTIVIKTIEVFGKTWEEVVENKFEKDVPRLKKELGRLYQKDGVADIKKYKFRNQGMFCNTCEQNEKYESCYSCDKVNTCHCSMNSPCGLRNNNKKRHCNVCNHKQGYVRCRYCKR
eukprot:Pgem_evm1s6832